MALADNVYFDISATVTLVADSPVEDELVWTLQRRHRSRPVRVGLSTVFARTECRPRSVGCA